MSTRKALPVGTMFLVLVIALALVGVGFALWSETLTIEGTVSTGEVDVELSAITSEECVDVNGVLTCPEPSEKADVANCTVTESGPDEDSVGDSGTDKLLVTVTGMYPSYHCKVSFKVLSTGNVPVHVWLPEPIANGGIPDWVSTNFEDCYTDGVQLHQDDLSLECTIDIHFTNDQAPDEGASDLHFGWTILATQWNEDPSCQFSFEPIGEPYQGLYGSTVTPVNVTEEDCSTTNALKIDSLQAFSDGQSAGVSAGWAGWSCIEPGFPHVVGGGFFPASSTIIAQGPAKYGAPPIDGSNYPVYPHYIFNGGSNTPDGEEGWVVEAAGPTPPDGIYVICGP